MVDVKYDSRKNCGAALVLTINVQGPNKQESHIRVVPKGAPLSFLL